MAPHTNADGNAKRSVSMIPDLPGVGKNLHDHLMAPLRFLATKDTADGESEYPLRHDFGV
jgi:hypothetical protein